MGLQYLYGIGTVLTFVLLGLLIHDWVGHRVVAFMLIVAVSLTALFLDILPLLVCALLSALLWDLLFIPPRFTFSVGTAEDQVLFLTYVVIVLIHSVLTYKIRQVQKAYRTKEEKARELKLYNTLFNSLSHELRTPITAIMAASDSLQSSPASLDDASKAELLSEITKASARLNEQVDNLLSISRLESSALQLKKDWCDIRELIYTALRSFDETERLARIHVFVPDGFPLFRLDFGLMKHVLHKLISNAIQHTPEGTDIVISADCLEEKLVITVSDNGKGFPQEDIHRVFDKFYRVRGSRSGGTGLGLSIVRGFVEAHGGTVSLRNLPLRGAEFTIEIPTEINYLNRLKND